MKGGKRKHLQVSWFIFRPFPKDVRLVIATCVSFPTLVLNIFVKKREYSKGEHLCLPLMPCPCYFRQKSITSTRVAQTLQGPTMEVLGHAVWRLGFRFTWAREGVSLSPS